MFYLKVVLVVAVDMMQECSIICHKTWASDNTDAICRLKIQYGTSILFPAITMGSHVSIVPKFTKSVE